MTYPLVTAGVLACACAVAACTFDTAGVAPAGSSNGPLGLNGAAGGLGTGWPSSDDTDAGEGGVAPSSGGSGAGVDAPDGGATGGPSGAADGGALDDDGTPPTPMPRMPEPPDGCPALQSGRQTLMGLEVDILAGEANDTPSGPLLFYWHGAGQSSTEGLGGVFGQGAIPDSVQESIVAQGGMIVAPNDSGLAREGQDVTFLVGTWYAEHDLALADLIVACATQHHGIDPRRIYATGCGAGGFMAGSMALLRSSYVAAVAPNSGGIAVADAFELEDPAHVPAAMLMHGGPGDNTLTNFEVTSDYLRDVLRDAGGLVLDCNHALGHCGAPAAMQTAAWRFMQDHPFGATSTYSTKLPASFPGACTPVP